MSLGLRLDAISIPFGIFFGSSWVPFGFDLDSTWVLFGSHWDSTWLAFGIHLDSAPIRAPVGYHVGSIWLQFLVLIPCGHEDSIGIHLDSIWTLDSFGIVSGCWGLV